MSVNSPGDALPCSIPQANAEKLRAIGAKAAPTTGGASEAQAPGGRTVPLAPQTAVGRLLDLEA